MGENSTNVETVENNVENATEKTYTQEELNKEIKQRKKRY